MKLLATIFVFASTLAVHAQLGVLPFTGMRYTEAGIHAEEINVDLAEETWTSNRLPINTEFEIQLEDPTGFQLVEGLYHPGIEVLITNLKGDTMGYAENIFGEKSLEGFLDSELSKLSLTLAFNEQSKAGDSCLLRARFFDLKSERSLTCWLDLVITDNETPLETTNSTFGMSSSNGYKGMASGAEISSMSMLYDNETHHRLDITNYFIDPIVGISQDEWLKGTFTFQVYDTLLIPSAVPRDSYDVTYTVSPGEEQTQGKLQVSTILAVNLVRLRWESEDKRKVIDVIAKM
ncbi:MAG: hypothetical protein A3D31_04010 [Candidatus Fluviicola riflensis]|nr:MAG: hypothetical protein CHH17_11020 [Candidatus Fluviicola riflensis]OGS79142.1 MAG: hypothetical protein A3D31_04010 [Candidatus Fluviicola riflensis]OGS86574.1 MAG: hypothetical protein A2724_03470 [Fluviicola sp. RIFCSPHIGHO2_01_FULL_43_53]OGS88952.1 MAG: hypothetical protein A3E30_01190 [Fluviicola sp. RIFCSPHIGHO2_12_FULL_43_24]